LARGGREGAVRGEVAELRGGVAAGELRAGIGVGEWCPKFMAVWLSF
jgi:hypothetical protein